LVLTVIGLYLTSAAMEQAHRDAEQAHQDARRALAQAHEDAKRALRQSQRDANARDTSSATGRLTDEDIRAIADQIEDDLKRDRAKP
jgi:Sec-independent protein translocase protein TatA